MNGPDRAEQKYSNNKFQFRKQEPTKKINVLCISNNI